MYIACVAILGLAAIAHSTYSLYGQPEWRQWLPLAALTLLSGSVTIRVPSVGATISVSETFVFTSVLLFGPSAGTLIAALDGLIISLWLQRRGTSLKRILFNLSAPALSIWVAATLFFLTAKTEPLYFAKDTTVSSVAPSVILLGAVYFLLNSWLMAFAVSIDRRVSPLQIWVNDFLWVSLSFFGGASVAALLVAFTRDVNLTAVAIIIPLLVISYLTFKTAFGRSEDQIEHLRQLNHLYLSTIETLAMAIDAKDQITHGHIRRVQDYAIRLARVLGVKDESHIKAIEAAALLHDMGKLAVPEYILNKPGKLTESEFAKMKLHASVGADILSSIDFPYPVVPIVRHHHENWDGSGYPDGLSGTAIPIGARILSIVDCFDALTSDRPYRPRLADEDALQVLRDRRGTMYDPLIVDTFLAVYREVAPESKVLPPVSALEEITRSALLADPLERRAVAREIVSGTDEIASLYHFARALDGKSDNINQTGDAVAQHLSKLIPAALLVLFLREGEGDKDELVAKYAAGSGDSVLYGHRILFGQRIAGWVAANRHTIINADPALDFGTSARLLTPALKSCLSTPLTKGGFFLGVISIYSTVEAAFTEDHRRILETIAPYITEALARSYWFAEQRSSMLVNDLSMAHVSALPAHHHAPPTMGTLSPDAPFGLIVIEVLSEHCPHKSLAPFLSVEIKKHLRSTDAFFAYSNREWIALLSLSERDRVRECAQTIARAILGSGISETIVRWATAPHDGDTLTELFAIAKKAPVELPQTGNLPPRQIH